MHFLLSRLWDAVGGFLFLFSHMQDKLSKHSSQVDLLKELLNLQKDMITMMLSMLEGMCLYTEIMQVTTMILTLQDWEWIDSDNWRKKIWLQPLGTRRCNKNCKPVLHILLSLLCLVSWVISVSDYHEVTALIPSTSTILNVG